MAGEGDEASSVKSNSGPPSRNAAVEPLSNILTVLAGLGSLTLLMGFPAVALQFRAFGVPIDLAPDRSFLLAGALPTAAVVLAMIASTGPISIPQKSESSWWEGVKIMWHSPLTLVLGWPILVAATILLGAAQIWTIGEALWWLSPTGAGGTRWRWILGAAAWVPSWIFFVRYRKHWLIGKCGTPFGVGLLLLVLYAGDGLLYVPLIVAAPLVPLLTILILPKPFSQWAANRLLARAVKDPTAAMALTRLASLTPISLGVWANFGVSLVLAEGARASLVVLDVLPRSTAHAPWIMIGLVAGLLTNHGLVVVLGRLMAGEMHAPARWSAVLFGSSSAAPSAVPGSRLARGAHVVLVVSLSLIYMLGGYARIPRSFLGGRPECVGGVMTANLSSAAAGVGSLRPLGGDRFQFDRLCVLVATSDHLVLCGADRPPASCLVLKRDDVSGLVTAGGSQGR